MVDSGVVRFRRVRSVSVSFECDLTKIFSDGVSCRDETYASDPGCFSKSLGSNGRTHSYGSILKETAGQFTTAVFTDLINYMKTRCFSLSDSSYFKFKHLPDNVKLMIFSYLSCKNLGVALCVCKEWNGFLRNPSIWSNIDFSEFKFCLKDHSHFHKECSMLCYSEYVRRMKKLIAFLISIKPTVRHLKFSFDIGDPDDGWRELLADFLKSCKFKELKIADINWTETVYKKSFLPQCSSATWSHSDLKDIMSKRRLRQRYFIRLFDIFTAVAPNVVELHLPFDWSEKSIEAFSRLSSLKVLELKKYFSYGVVMPDEFCRFLLCFPHLKTLILELWSENYGGYRLYQINSTTLVELDISQCQGVYFNVVNTPNLQIYKVSRVLTQWPFESPHLVANPQCMYHVLKSGAPNLLMLNDHKLSSNWKESISPGLDRLLSQVCFCRAHINSGLDDLVV